MLLLVMTALLLLWPMLCQWVGDRRRVLLNTVLACVAAFIILYTTILTRTPGVPAVILTPFATFTAARVQPELYREMLMNVFLFFPLGLTLSNALPRKWHRWLRIILTTFVSYALSAGIEYAQYRYALGMAEVDDVIYKLQKAACHACSENAKGSPCGCMAQTSFWAEMQKKERCFLLHSRSPPRRRREWEQGRV